MRSEKTLALSVEDYHGKFCIAELYRDAVVAPIIERQGLNINPDSILVLLDDNTTSIAERCVRAALMPEMMSDVLFQITGRRYRILLRLSQGYMATLEPRRITYYVYDALRHFERDIEKGDERYIYVREHDFCLWHEVLPYIANKQALPDLSEVTIYGEVVTSANVDSEKE